MDKRSENLGRRSCTTGPISYAAPCTDPVDPQRSASRDEWWGGMNGGTLPMASTGGFGNHVQPPLPSPVYARCDARTKSSSNRQFTHDVTHVPKELK